MFKGLSDSLKIPGQINGSQTQDTGLHATKPLLVTSPEDWVSTSTNKPFLDTCKTVPGDIAKPCMACQKFFICYPHSHDTMSCTLFSHHGSCWVQGGRVSEVDSVSAQTWKGKHTAQEAGWPSRSHTTWWLWIPCGALWELFSISTYQQVNCVLQSPSHTRSTPHLSPPLLEGAPSCCHCLCPVKSSPIICQLVWHRHCRRKNCPRGVFYPKILAIPLLIFRNLVSQCSYWCCCLAKGFLASFNFKIPAVDSSECAIPHPDFLYLEGGVDGMSSPSLPPPRLSGLPFSVASSAGARVLTPVVHLRGSS